MSLLTVVELVKQALNVFFELQKEFVQLIVVELVLEQMFLVVIQSFNHCEEFTHLDGLTKPMGFL